MSEHPIEQLDDPRAVRSRAALIGAMTQLLDAGELDAVSVTRLVAVAGVTRPTFYQHWPDLATLASDAAIARLRAEFARHDLESGELDAPWEQRVAVVVHRLLAHLDEHADFYRRVFTGPSATQVFDAAVDVVDERMLQFSRLGGLVPAAAEADEASAHDRIAIIAGGVVWLLSRWLLTERRGPDAVAAMSHRVTAQLIALVAGAEQSGPAGATTSS